MDSLSHKARMVKICLLIVILAPVVYGASSENESKVEVEISDSPQVPLLGRRDSTNNHHVHRNSMSNRETKERQSIYSRSVECDCVADTYVQEGNPNTSYGNDSIICWGRDSAAGNAGHMAALLRFDLSDIPSGATINYATLYMYNVGGSWDAIPATIGRCRSYWSESSTYNDVLDLMYDDWYDFSRTVPARAWFSLDVTDFVESWVEDGSSNYGVGIGPSDFPAPYGYQSCVAREQSGTTNDPYLLVNYDYSDPPDNDDFSDRQSLSGASGQVTGSNVDATKESGEPNHAGNSGGASVWYSWTAPYTGSVTIDTNGSDFDTLLGVYNGSSVSNLTEVASDDDGGEGTRSSVTFNAVNGTNYKIAVDGYSGNTGNITLNWDLPWREVDRIEIRGDSEIDEGDSANYTLYIIWDDGTEEQATWSYSVLPFSIASGEDYATICRFTTDYILLCADGEITQNQQVLLQADFMSKTDTHNITIINENDPRPDFIVESIELDDYTPNIDQLVTAYITVKNQGDVAGDAGALDVWRHRPTPANVGEDGDADVDVGVLQVEESNIYYWEFYPEGTGSQTFRAFIDSANETPEDDDNNNQSTRTYTVVEENRPPNDDFGSASAISGASGQSSGTNVGATKESGEPNHAGNSGGASVWYSWTAPCAGEAVFDTNGSDFDTLLAVYTGSSVSSLSEIGSDDDGGEGTRSLVTFNATSGTNYKIAVDGYGGSTGNIVLNWEIDCGGQYLTISPSSRDHDWRESSGNQISVSSNVSWTASENLTWIEITAGSSGSNNGAVVYTVMENRGSSPRDGTITVSGGGIDRDFTVNQAGHSAGFINISGHVYNRRARPRGVRRFRVDALRPDGSSEDYDPSVDRDGSFSLEVPYGFTGAVMPWHVRKGWSVDRRDKWGAPYVWFSNLTDNVSGVTFYKYGGKKIVQGYLEGLQGSDCAIIQSCHKRKDKVFNTCTSEVGGFYAFRTKRRRVRLEPICTDPSYDFTPSSRDVRGRRNTKRLDFTAVLAREDGVDVVQPVLAFSDAPSTAPIADCYNIVYDGTGFCEVTSDSVLVSGVEALGSLRITRKRGGARGRAGLPVVRLVATEGAFTRVYTEAPITSLVATGDVGALAARGCHVEDIACSTVLRVSIRAYSSEDAFTSIRTNGDLMRQARIDLVGVGLDVLDAPGQRVNVSVSSKKVRGKGGAAYVSYAGVEDSPSGDDEMSHVLVGELSRLFVHGGDLGAVTIESTRAAKRPCRIRTKAVIFSPGRKRASGAGPILYPGDIYPELVAIGSARLSIVADGGDIDVDEIHAAGVIRELISKARRARTTDGVEWLGGFIGDEYVDGDVDSGGPLTADDFMLVAAGVGAARRADIVRVHGDLGVSGLFMAGADDSAQGSTPLGLLDELSLTPNYSGTLRRIGTLDPGRLPIEDTDGLFFITGIGFSKNEPIYTGGDHTGFVWDWGGTE